MLFKKQINAAARKIDTEQSVISTYRKLMGDTNIQNNTILFADVTAKDLAATLNSAWGCIDILKFENGYDV
jgi:hypothetical protein